jgi:hypothetical protein
MSDSSAADRKLRRLVWGAIRATGTPQTVLASKTGYTPKHINCVLHGKSRLTLDTAEKMLAVMGFELVLRLRSLESVITTGTRDRPAIHPVSLARPTQPGKDTEPR